ncbi:hypothetical protein L3Y34_000840 [Caenorhabditis briggsae]|uniref:W02B3.4-like N-terminal domain-containing protein n=1 Tax=Caenorhabditis briggsae TaxID=6238 RepID=A0AAE9DAF2_CAEBR|nr:hypothetical protein L3Y34_000840 [Caenorhabditis briggsae]
MSNNLNDIMEVLEHNAGRLTENDRNIPEEDEAVIRSSAWSQYPPVIQTEDSAMRLQMQNNQVHIDYPLISEKLNTKLYEMRRRSATHSEDVRRSVTSPEVNNAPADYHYSYDQDISLGINQMSINQHPVTLLEDSDDSTTHSSSSSSDDSGSEYTPSPYANSRTPSEFPCLPTDIETRRLSKTQKRNMSKRELEERRKEANKKNSKNYNKNKKQKEAVLQKDYEKKKNEFVQLKMEEKKIKNMIKDCYLFTGTVVVIPENEGVPTIMDQTTLYNRIREINLESDRRKHNCENLKKLAETYQVKVNIHTVANNDMKLKRININTYGSRKSRALHSMNIAHWEFKLAELEFDKQKLMYRTNLMKMVKRQMAGIFNFRHAGPEYVSLSQDQQILFDELCDSLRISLDSKKVTSPQCILFLESLFVPYPALLIDNHVLQSLHNEQCEKHKMLKIKVAIDSKYVKKRDNESLLFFEFVEMNNRTNKDYLQFSTQPTRVIPKNFETYSIGNLSIPTNIPMFLEMWKRAKCLGLPVHRNRTKTQQPNHGKAAAGKLAEFRDVLLKFNIFSFLNGGTLLGWYRECGIIPHTEDMDIAVFSKDFRPELVDFLQSISSPFRLLRRIGRINDSFELTISSKDSYPMNMDLFVMYEEINKDGNVTNWVGGASYTQKFKYTYPEYDPWCTADLYGYLFWVTCSPQKMLIFEYGNLWYEDVPSSDYNWKSSANNVQKNGFWKEEELKQVYVMY